MDKDKDLSQIAFTLRANGYELVDHIGSGGFANVFKVYSNSYKQYFAAKVFDIGNSKLIKNISSCSTEIKALSSIYHQNVVSIYNHFNDGRHLYIILELCSGGSILTKIKSIKKSIPGLVMSWLEQTLRALAECHRKKISHHDIKPSNILLDQYGRVKLADFGLSIFNETMQKSLRFGGSKPFCAPELFMGKHFEPFKSDIWALGITFYVISFGHFPFHVHCDDIADQVIKCEIKVPETGDPKLSKIISLMLQKDPEKRPSCDELLAEFFDDKVVKEKKMASLQLQTSRQKSRKGIYTSKFGIVYPLTCKLRNSSVTNFGITPLTFKVIE